MHKILAKSGHDIGGGTTKKPDETRGAASSDGPLDTELLRQIDAWWRAANFLSVGQTYLFDNPLLKKPLNEEHVKPRLVGHWNNV